MKRKFIYASSLRSSRVYTQVGLYKSAYMHIHALSCKEKRVYVGNLTFGPWQLVLGIFTYGFGPWYLDRRVDP